MAISERGASLMLISPLIIVLLGAMEPTTAPATIPATTNQAATTQPDAEVQFALATSLLRQARAHLAEAEQKAHDRAAALPEIAPLFADEVQKHQSLEAARQSGDPQAVLDADNSFIAAQSAAEAAVKPMVDSSPEVIAARASALDAARTCTQ